MSGEEYIALAAMMCVEMAEDAKRCLERCCSDAVAIQQGIQQWRLATDYGSLPGIHQPP